MRKKKLIFKKKYDYFGDEFYSFVDGGFSASMILFKKLSYCNNYCLEIAINSKIEITEFGTYQNLTSLAQAEYNKYLEKAKIYE